MRASSVASVDELLPPALRARLASLRLEARHPAAGRGFGQHASRARGAGLEFAQYRAYEPGDDLRQIDWKLYARADRYYVRDAERESPLQLWLLLDLSASMAQADRDAGGPTRLDRAKTVAAALAQVASAQGDACGLIALGGNNPPRLPALAGPRHLERVLHALAAVEAGGGTLDEAALAGVLAQIPAQAIVVVLSDGFDDGLVGMTLRLAALGRDLRWLLLTTADERDFPFTGSPRFRDVEADQRSEIDAGRARSDFLARFGAARADLGRRLQATGARVVSLYTDADPLPAVRALAGSR